jgi:hypothetical protein
LRPVFRGGWLTPEAMPGGISGILDVNKGMRYTMANYYVINRAAIMLDYPFPDDVEPEFLIKHRGFTQAWVFRGDKLKKKGYKLTNFEW